MGEGVDVDAWARDELYGKVGDVSREEDRYARLLEQDPLHLNNYI